MCCGAEQLNRVFSSTYASALSSDNNRAFIMEINHLTVETEDNFMNLLELAANNDVEGFKRSIEHDPSGIDEAGLWYGRQKGSKQMFLEHRTPLMIAATYGSIDVLKLILSLSIVDVNRSCGLNRSTALHCAASGGSENAAEIVKLLLAAGANPNLIDASGHRPVDVIVVGPLHQKVNFVLEELLITSASIGEHKTRVLIEKSASASNSPPLSPSRNNTPTSSASDISSSPESSRFNDLAMPSPLEKKEYPVDPSMPDIKNSIYATDEFRMYSFKIRPCSRAYSHDWTECPFVHPGENARRRDPRKYHYSCVPCPEFRKGTCRRGDMCEYAHGVFECWLHPAQYRTRLCKDGLNCNRRVCFFAHAQEELRPLFVSTGSAIPSPHCNTSAANAMDFAAAMSLFPSSPSAASMNSPSPFTPPMSPAGSGMPNLAWSQPVVPTLHLPGSNLQSNRLRPSLHARDVATDDIKFSLKYDVEQQLFDELPRIQQQANTLNRSTVLRTLTPSNLEDLFFTESSSPRYSNQVIASPVFSPTHRSTALSQVLQQQGILSPGSQIFSPRTVDHPLLQASLTASPSGRMSPRNIEPPTSSRVSMLGQREKQEQQFRSLSSRDLGFNSGAVVGSPVDGWSKLGSTNGRTNWGLRSGSFDSGFQRSSSFEIGSGEEPDLSWVQSLVKESSQEVRDEAEMHDSGIACTVSYSSDNSNFVAQTEQVNQSTLGAWLEKVKFDQPMDQ